MSTLAVPTIPLVMVKALAITVSTMTLAVVILLPLVPMMTTDAASRYTVLFLIVYNLIGFQLW